MSCIIYKFIIIPRKQTTKGKGKQGDKSADITPFLVGFGVVMPLCVIYPFYANSYFIVRSKIWWIALAVVLIYGTSVGHGYTLDDTPAILQHPAVVGDVPWWEVFVREYWGERLDSVDWCSPPMPC